MGVYGLGHDVVDVAAFGEQLGVPGSHMRELFSVREVRQAAARAVLKNDGEAVHLAAKWAGKEAVLKAWCEALGDGPLPYTIDDFPWAGVEILDDSRGVPHVRLRADVEAALRGSLPPVAGGIGTVSPAGGVMAGTAAGGPSGGMPAVAAPTPTAMLRASAVVPGAGMAAASASAGAPAWRISLSHDGAIASAVAMLVSS